MQQSTKALLNKQFLPDRWKKFYNGEWTLDDVDRDIRESEGIKFDEGKVRMELFPTDSFRAISKILTFGARKYDDRNWEKGMEWSRVYGALQRHLTSWFEGDDKDSETGYSHLWHAGCCIVFLIAYEIRGVGTDDRPQKSQ